MTGRVQVIALVKEGQRYVFLYDESSLTKLMHTLGRYAADPQLNFTWYDAALLSQKIRRLQTQAQASKPHFGKKTTTKKPIN